MRGVIKEFREEMLDCHEIRLAGEDIEIIKEMMTRHMNCVEDGQVSVNVTGEEELVSIDCDTCGVRIIDSNRIKLIQAERRKVASA